MNASIAYVNGAGSQRRMPADDARDLQLLNTLLAGAGSERPGGEKVKSRQESSKKKAPPDKDFSTPGGFKNDPKDPNNPNEARERHRRQINR